MPGVSRWALFIKATGRSATVDLQMRRVSKRNTMRITYTSRTFHQQLCCHYGDIELEEKQDLSPLLVASASKQLLLYKSNYNQLALSSDWRVGEVSDHVRSVV